MSHLTLSDSLLESLLLFAKLYHKPVSKQALLDGLPVQQRSGVDLLSVSQGETLFEYIARKAGFKSKLYEKGFQKLNALHLPCILILQDGNSCILEELDPQKQEAKIILPELPDTQELVTYDKLEKLYSGKLFLLKKSYRFKGVHSELLKERFDHWLWDTLKKNRSIYKDVVLTSILINLFVLASPLFVMNVYDRVVPNFAVESLWALSIGVVIIFVLDAVLKFLRTYFLETAAKKTDVIISSSLFEKIMGTKLSHRPGSVGSFAHTIKDFDLIKNFLSASTVAVLVDLPFVVIFLSVITYLSGVVVLIPLAVIAAVITFALIIKKPLHGSIEEANESIAQKNGILIESLNALETIKSLGVSGHARWKWEEATGDIAHKGLKTKMLSASVTSFTSFMMQLNTVLIIIVGVYQIHDAKLSLGGLIAAVILSSRAIAPMGQLASLISSFEQTKHAFSMLDNIFDLPDERPPQKDLIHKNDFSGALECKDLHFSYDEEKTILNGVSLSVRPGEKIAILGKMGSGKSTLLKLIMKLFEAPKGELLLDGVDIKQIEPADIRTNISYISQEAMLFNGTLKENILYKSPYAGDKALINALRVSQLLDFVNSHPKGMDMVIGERGDTLSGGQRKAVSIARSLVGDFSLLLMDEPTDNMDIQTENALKRQLGSLLEDKTLLLVTHKTSMLDLVDRVIVMDRGRIVLDGPKREVLEKLGGGDGR